MVYILFNWVMPRYREPLWIEVMINNFLNMVSAYLSQLLHDTRLEYWLVDPQGQVGTLFMTTILVALVWLIVLEYSSNAEHRAASQTIAEAHHDNVQQQSEDFHENATPKTTESHLDSVPSTPSSGETPFMRKLAPPNHQPTNANLNTSPFHVARPSFNVGTSSDRTNLVSTPSYQTPVNKRITKQDFENIVMNAPTPSLNFSSLAKQAPVSYETLQETGMLNPDGTPTKKWAGTSKKDADELEAYMARFGIYAWKKGAPGWEEKMGKKAGRAD